MSNIDDAINSLRSLTKCTCHEAYSGRGMEDPNCLHHEYAEYVEALAARVVALEEVSDALENLIIAMGMGWDLDGVIDVAQQALDKSGSELFTAAQAARAKLEDRA